ncbi:AMP-binding protein [Phenylobacterium sp.]|uniref:AMP-binding protein n=1 Tax=Phenylobacterium sp. TaxID=1871053 RepID=UPI00289DBFE1|nr:AMP-binding protein [Phenylobacterium sp.]
MSRENALKRIRQDREHLRRRWYEEGFYGTKTIGDVLREGAAAFPHAKRSFYSSERPEREFTLQEGYLLSSGYAARLQKLGVGPGDVVAVQMPNWWETVMLSQAVILAGATLLPIIPIYGAGDLQYILTASRAKMLIVPRRMHNIDFLERLEALGSLPDLEHVLVVGDEAPRQALTWEQFLSIQAEDFVAPAITSDDTCLLMFTSGTTSKPKGVRHTHNTLIAETGTFPLYRPVDQENPVFLSAGPFGHIGSALELIRGSLTGGSNITRDRWEAQACLDLISRLKPCTSNGVPFFMLTLFDLVDKGLGDISSLKYFTMGGTSINPSQILRLAEAGITGLRTYGSTELPTISSGRKDDPLEKRAYTDGRLLPGVEIRIVDDDDQDVGEGESGELLARGPDLFVGYLDEALDLDAFLPGGWFRTGDIVSRDADGYLSVVDRKKDVIIRGGENLSSKEIEDALCSHPAIAESAAVAMPDPLYGEKVCAFVVLRPGHQVSLDAVRVHFGQLGLAKQKTPERLEIVTDFPRTPRGKVKKIELREQLKAQV